MFDICMSWSFILLQVVKRSEERPTLRSVANAIRTGIFIEKIYRRMSKSQMMAVPEAVEHRLQVNIETSSAPFNFDSFATMQCFSCSM